MLNLTLVQKHLSAKYTSQRVQNFDLQSCASTPKEKTNTTKESLELTIVSSFPTRLCWQWWDFSNSVLHLPENWMWDTVRFVLRNRKLDMLVVETLPKLFMW